MNYGVSSIVVIGGTNRKEIFVSTLTGGGLLTKNFGNGILWTQDAGKNWEHIGPGAADDIMFPLAGLVANKQDQSQMAAFYKKDLYLTTDKWKKYKKSALPFHKDVDNVEIADVEYAPHEKGKIYVTTKTYLKNRAQLFMSTDNGENWKDITPSDVQCERIAIATFSDPKYIGKYYITSGNTDVYVKYFNGAVFSQNLNVTPVRHFGASSFWCLELEVNQVDTSVLYLSLTETSRSTDGGKGFVKIANYNGLNTHADVRGMHLAISSANGMDDVLLLANDGGVSINNSFRKTRKDIFRNLNGQGLNANQFWGINVLQSDTLMVAGGAQDNGGFVIKSHAEYNNLHNCGDGYFALPLNDSIVLVEGNPPNFLWFNIKSGENRFIPIADPNFEARRPLFLKDSFVYVGYHYLWRVKYRDIVQAKFNFENVSKLERKSDPNKGAQNREIKAVCVTSDDKALIGYANPNWDAAKNEGKLYYCHDLTKKNPEYIDITALTANRYVELCRWSQVESIANDQENTSVFYAIYKDVFDQRNSEIYRIVYDKDSNRVDLVNATYNLRKVGFNKLFTDKFSNVLYVATNDGLYYRSLRHNDTVFKSLNFFPKVMVSDVAINYVTNTLYASTFGRGIYYRQVPSFKKDEIKLRKNTVWHTAYRVDGTLTLNMNKKLSVNAKLIVTTGSKIVLKRGAVLLLQRGVKVVNENNQTISLNDVLVLNKRSKVILK